MTEEHDNAAVGAEDQEAASSKAKRGESDGSKPKPRTVLVRYGKMGLIGQFRHSEREIPKVSCHVVVNTERGLEIGEVISPYCHHRGTFDFSAERIDAYCEQSGENYPLSRQGRVVRLATEQDMMELRHIEKDIAKERAFCEELIGKHGLPMRLVEAEHLFGGDRIIYYFMADGRVDFRQLVKELAHEYQTRIELRQVGARDEARLLADLETCGRECCCKNFLKVLQPVNMRMAKTQKATLDPSKISGRCGRLKCCLRYEDLTYQHLMKSLPRNNSLVLTASGPAKVLAGQILTQLVRVQLVESGAIMAVAVEDLLETDYKLPPEGAAKPAEGRSGRPDRSERSERSGRPKPAERPDRSGEPRGEPVASSAAPASSENQEDGQQTKKKRRRRRRKKSKGSNGDGGSSSGSSGGGQGGGG